MKIDIELRKGILKDTDREQIRLLASELVSAKLREQNFEIQKDLLIRYPMADKERQNILLHGVCSCLQLESDNIKDLTHRLEAY